MIFTETKLSGAFIIDVEKRGDNRGFFARVFCRSEFEAHGLNAFVAQANTSYSKYQGTLRGMHFQRAPHEEAKLVRCTRGALHDVIIDLRPDSPTFQQWIGVDLTSENHRMLYVPEGFGHGFQTLVDDTEVTYLVSEFYAPQVEGGVRYNDPAFGIDWPGEVTVISDKDRNWPDFE
ncbi:dTDP-4-dehydrorhamnose 3,5-epimerase [Bacteroidota bacterium]